MDVACGSRSLLRPLPSGFSLEGRAVFFFLSRILRRFVLLSLCVCSRKCHICSGSGLTLYVTLWMTSCGLSKVFPLSAFLCPLIHLCSSSTPAQLIHGSPFSACPQTLWSPLPVFPRHARSLLRWVIILKPSPPGLVPGTFGMCLQR